MELKDIRIDTTTNWHTYSIRAIHLPTGKVAFAHGKLPYRTKKEALKLLQDQVSGKSDDSC